ncbi:MAG: tetratricopeptide repeat protein [Blastocatellia bacterium]
MKTRLVHAFLSYWLDPEIRMLFKEGRPIPLAPQTYRLLYTFAMHPHEVLTTDFIVQEAWNNPSDGVSDEAVAQQITYLRKALGKDGNIVVTYRGKRKCKYPDVKADDISTRYSFEADVTSEHCPSPEALTEPNGNLFIKQVSAADEEFGKGRYHWLKSTPAAIQFAIPFFDRAIELDRNHADSYAAKADCWILLGSFGHQVRSALEVMPKAKEAAERSLQINPNMPIAHYALASQAALFEWDWAKAIIEFEKAIELAPQDPMVRAWFALCLAHRGENDRARILIDQAIGLLPRDYLNPAFYLLTALSGRIYYLAGSFGQAIRECQRGIEVEDFYLSHVFIGHAYRQLKQHQAALTEFEQASRLVPDNPVVLAEIGHIYGRLGKREESLTYLGHLDRVAEEQNIYLSPHTKSHVYLGLGDTEKAVEYLEKTFDERGCYMTCLTSDPVYQPLYSNSRFRSLVQRVGYADTSIWEKAVSNLSLAH